MHEALVAYLYGEATPEESHRVEMHLKECAACEKEIAAFENVRGMLQQWQLDELPGVRIATSGDEAGRRSALAVFKELFTVMPVWAKAFGTVAMALVVFAVLGIEVKAGRDGLSVRADIFRLGKSAGVESGSLPQPVSPAPARQEMSRAEVEQIVNHLILESDRNQTEELKTQLVSLEAKLKDMNASDLAKLAAQIQQQRTRIKTLERDIDRREGLDLTDILFSEVTSNPGDNPVRGTRNDGD